MIKAVIFDCFGVIYQATNQRSDDQLNGQLLEYIKQLKVNYKTAVLSNTNSGFLAQIFSDEQPWHNYFDDLIASADIGVAKPDVRAFNIAAAKLGVEPSQCVFIDDNQTNCFGAEDAGMKAILYTDFATLKNDLKSILQ